MDGSGEQSRGGGPTSSEQIMKTGALLLQGFIQDRAGRMGGQTPELAVEQGPQDESTKKLSECLKRIGDELDSNMELQRMIAAVDTDSPREVFFRVAADMFADGNFNWGRVVALFYFASKLVLKVGGGRAVRPGCGPQADGRGEPAEGMTDGRGLAGCCFIGSFNKRVPGRLCVAGPGLGTQDTALTGQPRPPAPVAPAPCRRWAEGTGLRGAGAGVTRTTLRPRTIGGRRGGGSKRRGPGQRGARQLEPTGRAGMWMARRLRDHREGDGSDRLLLKKAVR